MHLSLRGARRATATAMTFALAAAGLLTTACTPQSFGDKVLSGTVQGADGKFVDVYIGFDVLDSAGNKIVLGGGGPGYSSAQRLNHCVSTDGAWSSTTCAGTGYQTTKNWSLVLPPNAATVYIEVYPKAPSSSAFLYNYKGYTGPFPGGTNTSTYGEAYRRAIPVPGNMANISIVLPIVCGQPGGTTGSLTGHVNGWPIGVTGHVNAWAMTPITYTTQGFSAGSLVDAWGNYRIDKLAAGERYGLVASAANGWSKNVVNYTNSTTNATMVNSCSAKSYNFNN